MTTFHIRVEKNASYTDQILDTLGALDRGDDPELSEPVLSVESLATLGEILRPTNLAVLEAVAKHEPESIRALARILERAPGDVLANVNELEEVGLLRVEQHGQARRPVVWYDELDIDIPMHHDDAPTDEAPADD